MCVPWLIHVCGAWLRYTVASYESLMCVPLPIHTCDMTHYLEMLFDCVLAEVCCVGHDSFMPWLNCMSHWCVCHGLFICVIWIITWRYCLTLWLQRRVVWDMTRLYRDSFVWFLHVCTMAHSYVCGTWLMYAVTHSYETSTCGQWLIHMCDMTNSSGMFFDPMLANLCCVGHDSCMPWLFRVWDMNHSCVCHGSFLRLIHMCDMTHYLEMLFGPVLAEVCCVGHDSFTCVIWLM